MLCKTDELGTEVVDSTEVVAKVIHGVEPLPDRIDEGMLFKEVRVRVTSSGLDVTEEG